MDLSKHHDAILSGKINLQTSSVHSTFCLTVIGVDCHYIFIPVLVKGSFSFTFYTDGSDVFYGFNITYSPSREN